MKEQQISADVAGTVQRVLVTPGQAVSADEPILIVECMKMEMEVQSPAGGVISKVLVAPGQLVEQDQPVAILQST